jgi:iron complex outermembrane receptor protein
MQFGKPLLLLAMALLAASRCALGQNQPPVSEDFSHLGLDDLLKVKVTTATKQAQQLGSIPAAVTVLTREEILSAGARSVMEALRLVPGVQVARVDASRYAISIRGFNHRYSNKLLVLIDGRSVYVPLFAGVYWEMNDIPLDDLDRIEVVRGPGGSLWGANAVNGVINIITRNTAETHGTAVSLFAGSQEAGSAYVRHGANLGASGHYRLYAYGRTHGALDRAGTTSSNRDGYESLRIGTRLDWGDDSCGRWFVSAEALNRRDGQTDVGATLFPVGLWENYGRYPASAWHALARWEKPTASGGEVAAQAFVNRYQINSGYYDETRTTLDLDLQHRFAPLGQHTLLTGFNARHTAFSNSGLRNGEPVIIPSRATNNTYGIFVHDSISIGQRLSLMLGARLDHNDFTGWEWQPNARATWQCSERTSWWASWARAVRTPTQGDRNLNILASTETGPGGLPVDVRISGDPNAPSEIVRAHEIGVRHRASESLSLDVSGFFNVYERVRARPLGTPFLVPGPPPYFLQPAGFGFTQRGETWGAELTAKFAPAGPWRATLTYAFLDYRMRITGLEAEPVAAPRNQATLRVGYSPSTKLDFDAVLYVTERLQELSVPGHSRLDLRAAWKPRKDLSIEVVGQNLLRRRHQEYNMIDFLVPSMLERSVYAKVTWKP